MIFSIACGCHIAILNGHSWQPMVPLTVEITIFISQHLLSWIPRPYRSMLPSLWSSIGSHQIQVWNFLCTCTLLSSKRWKPTSLEHSISTSMGSSCMDLFPLTTCTPTPYSPQLPWPQTTTHFHSFGLTTQLCHLSLMALRSILW